MIDNQNLQELDYSLYQQWHNTLIAITRHDSTTYFRDLAKSLQSLFNSEAVIVVLRDVYIEKYTSFMETSLEGQLKISNEILAKLFHNPDTGIHKINIIEDSLLNYLNISPKSDFCFFQTYDINSSLSVALFSSSFNSILAKQIESQWLYLNPILSQTVFRGTSFFNHEQQFFAQKETFFIDLDKNNVVTKTNIKSNLYILLETIKNNGLLATNDSINNLIVEYSIENRKGLYLALKKEMPNECKLIKLIPVTVPEINNKSDFGEKKSPLIEILPIGVMKVNNKGYITYANRWMLEFLDASNMNIEGTHIGRFLVHSTIPVKVSSVLRSRKQDTNDFVMSIITKSNRTRQASVTSLIMSEKEGAVLIVQDVEERLNLARQVKQKENDLLRLVNNKNMIIVRTDLSSNIIFANRTFLRIVGFVEEGVIGKPLREFLLYTESESFQKLWVKFTNYELTQTELAIKSSENTPVFWLASIQPSGDEVVFSGIDITELQRTRSMLDNSQKLINDVFDNIPGLVMVINKTYDILFTNQKEKLSDLEEKISCHQLSIDGDTLCENCQLHTVFSEKVSKQFEMYDEKNDKSYAVHTIPLPNKSGNVIYGLEFFQDITAQKKIQQSIQESKNAAEKVSKLKSSFISNINHEVRTPLNAIIGFSNLILSGNKSSEANKEFVEIIHENGNRLLDTISGLIELSRLQSGDFVLINEVFNLNKLLSYIGDSYREHNNIFSGKIQFNISVPTNQFWINTDKNRIIKIITQLLDNAIKFTEKGVVIMALEVRSDTLAIIIQDNGQGLNSDDFNAFFEYFGKDHMKTQPLEGPGLGLAIAYHNAIAIGGDLVLVKNVSQGTRFEILLPHEFSKITGENVSYQDKWSHKKILIAEDDDTNFIYLQELLAHCGFNISRAKNGNEAIALINENIDLVLLDIQMPFCDGITVAKTVREKGYKMPIIALTAHNFNETECLEAGCDMFLTKPIVSNTLYTIIEKYLAKSN